MSTSTTASATASASSASSTASGTISAGSNLKIVGIILAICSGVLIGSSFVFKKKGLLRSQAGHTAGEGVAYLKSPLWWLGMSMMILGELCNFAAYAFVEAIVVTPLGALSVVICAILSSFFLKETLSFFGWMGCVLCILGSVIIALNGPSEATVGDIREFQKMFLAPGFLAYAGVLIATSLVIIFYFAPKYGTKSMLWYISVCSMIGGISVSVTTGLGAAIVKTAQGQSQFKYWFMYFLIGFVVITLVTEVFYLNKALALFNTAMVTPTYYVIFTFFSIVTTIVLFQGLSASASDIITLVMGFLVICVGITILQMSKVDPVQLSKLDRRSTILLQAARAQTATMDEKDPTGIEDPGMDALRGSFGTFGSIIRARSARRLSQNSRKRPSGAAPPFEPGHAWLHNIPSPNPDISAADRLNGMQRHQLYDAPVPLSSTPPSLAGATRGDDNSSVLSSPSLLMNKRPTIKFDDQEVIHQYHPTGELKGQRDDKAAVHEHRLALGTPGVVMHGGGSSVDGGYPPRPINTSLPTPTQNLIDDSDLSSTSTIRQQAVSLPTAFRNEHIVQSAPPTTSPRYTRQMADSRYLFGESPSSTTLLSFPSVTDSAQSWDDPDVNEEGLRHSRGRSAKRYPKGAGDDDRDESVSLFSRNAPGESNSDEDHDLPDMGRGIRLVEPSGRSF